MSSQDTEGEEQVAIDRAAQRDTHLTAWFKLNAENNEARQYSYIEIPYHFVFGKNCMWKVRQRGSDKVVVRMYKISSFCELFFLRLLLLHVKGAKSFEDLRIFADLRILNDNQRNVADAILAALSVEPTNENKHSRLFFMDGPAGCGKTFTYNYLISETQSRHIRTATAAWTGIAATLLKNGCTMHGLFKLPVPILETSTCNVTPNSIHGRFLRQISLYLLDEAFMIPKYALSAIDKLLQDICNNNFPFGGKVILMGGDFRQILPVVKRGRPAEVIESCLKCSEHWQYVQRFSLTVNMRVQIEEEEFSQWLLKLGSGTLPVKPEDPLRGCIEIPEQCFLSDNESIVAKIFGGAEEADYAKRAILTPTNVDSLAINEEVLHRLPGDVKTYLIEFLNSLTPSGMPVHCLKLKIGAVIMLLRNFDLKGGLCNGTRLMVGALHNNYIDGEVLTGVSAGNRVFVP
nr:ATP-dependent DNA helicase pif1-like [Hydra vulgaris]